MIKFILQHLYLMRYHTVKEFLIYFYYKQRYDIFHETLYGRHFSKMAAEARGLQSATFGP